MSNEQIPGDVANDSSATESLAQPTPASTTEDAEQVRGGGLLSSPLGLAGATQPVSAIYMKYDGIDGA